MCGDYVTATVLGGAKGNMIGAMIASQFSGAQNWPLGSAMAILMIAAVLLVLIVGFVITWLAPRVLMLASPIIQIVRRAIYERSVARRQIVEQEFRKKFEALPKVLSAWTVLVLVFLFIPILLVFLHSFNYGGSFTIWSGRASTKWWGELFNGGVMVALLIRFAVVIFAALIFVRINRRRERFSKRVLSLVMPLSFVFAVILNGLITEWYRTIFDFAGIGDSIRNSFIAAFGATVIAVLIGGMSGVALARRPVTGQSFLWRLYF